MKVKMTAKKKCPKLKLCKFFLTGSMQIICNNFFAKLLQSVFLSQKLSKKLKIKKSLNLTTEIGSKHNLLQEK